MSAERAPRALRGVHRTHEPMSGHTSWRVGGPADRFYEPADADDLVAFIASLPPEEPVIPLGLGSNLLVRDGGIRGTVILYTNRVAKLQRLDGDLIRAEAGVPCAKLARYAAREQLEGAEFLAGIPGTMGGALAMNAGAFGGETWKIVAAVETVDRAGERHTRAASEYHVGYRTLVAPSAGSDELFVAGHFRLKAGSHEGAREIIRSLLARRGATQPTQWPNAGSVFRNPPGDHAARLIEAAGLKGHKIGGAVVSALHANFILNEGNATAADIEALIEAVRRRVHAQAGVLLAPEVKIVGVAA